MPGHQLDKPLGYFVTTRQFERPSYCSLVMSTKLSESGEVSSRQYPSWKILFFIDEAPLTAVTESTLQKEFQTQNQKAKSVKTDSAISELCHPRHVT